MFVNFISNDELIGKNYTFLSYINKAYIFLNLNDEKCDLKYL
jgi:hypothetical protein